MTRWVIIALIVLLVLDIYPGIKLYWGRDFWIDNLFHFLGGLLVALLFISFYHSEFKQLPQSLRAFAIIGMTIGIGLVWEFLEYALDLTARGNFVFGGDLFDTMEDLLMDTLGAVLAVGLDRLDLLQRRNAK